MASNNPSITASNIITDVEARLENPNLSANTYLPWVSYGYNRLYLALMSADPRVREGLFGNSETFNLSAGVSEYSISTNIPRFGGIIKVEVKYGGTGDDWTRAKKLPSVSDYEVQNNNTTSYRAKENPLYFLLEDSIGFIPVPPVADSGTPQAKVFYVRRPYQITDVADVIDIDYRFIYPLANYVQAKAIERINEDYGQAAIIEREFIRLLEEVSERATSEFSGELDGGESVVVPSNSPLFKNPFA